MPFIRDALTRAPAERSRRRLPFLGATSTAADVAVAPDERSLQIGAVYACVRLLSEAVASLPVGVYRKSGDNREELPDHPLAELVADQPNPTIDAGELWRTVMGWMLLRGNAYVYVERGGGGQPVGLWPIAPTSVDVQRASNGRLVYRVTIDGDAEYAPLREAGGSTAAGAAVRAENMLHYRAFGLGVQGLSPIGMARQQIGISYAALSYVGGFFARDASPGGTVTVPGELSDAQYDRLTEQWRAMHEGFDRSHRLALLEGGAKWESVSLSPVDAAFLDVYKLSRTEIAAIYGVPPHKIGDLDRATFSNIEHQAIEYVTDSITPWLTRLERVTRQLRSVRDRGVYLRWNVDGLLRGDIQSRYSAYAQGRQWGWLSGNDVRRREDMAPVSGLDDYLQPLNMVPAGTTSPPNTRTRPAPGDPAARDAAPGVRRSVAQPPAAALPGWVSRHRETLAAYFADQRDAVLGDLVAARARRDAVDELLDVETWSLVLAAGLLPLMTDMTREVASDMAQQLGGNYDPNRARAFLAAAAMRRARSINTTTRDQVAAALAEPDGSPTAAIADVFRRALDERVHDDARALVNSIGHFARNEGARAGGGDSVTKTWIVTSRNPRTSHAAMHGETVGIDDTFSNGAQWPHDPDLDVDEIAGCMCTTLYTATAEG